MSTLVVPYPVSANLYWRSFVPKGHKRAIVVLSDVAKSYKTEVGYLAKLAGYRTPVKGRVIFNIKLYPGMPQDAQKRMRKLGDEWDTNVRSIDLDNALKVTIDALKGIAYEDDAQVWKIVAERCEPDGKARAEIEIHPIVREVRQSDLLESVA